MTITVRFAGPEDYLAASSIYDSQHDSQVTSECLLRAEESSSKRDPHFRRLIAAADGQVVGTGYICSNWAGVVQAGRYWVGFSVRPEWRGGGVDSRMLRYAVARIDGEARELATCMREDYVGAAGFLQDFGFEERFRSWGAHLDLRSFEPQRFEETIVNLERSGYRFMPYVELASEENDARLLELKREIDRDVLSFEPIVPADSVDILGEEYLRAGLIVALNEEGDFVGLASLRRSSPDGGVDSGLTGVLREYRGRGIATALKVRSLSVAKAMGATELGTGGGGTDSPVKRLNEKLGFQVGPEWVTFISEL